MKQNAIALANYFVDLALRDKFELRQIGLMKRVYITHGFHLAIFDSSALDSRFDVVEAWKNGPVIPSVYHSFKYNKNNPVIEKSIFMDFNENDDDNITYIIPALEDKSIIDVANFVWERYFDVSDLELIKLTHRRGTPWSICYESGKNNKIPDIYTKAFYMKFLKND
jgi:uncharacterized phage-associated protein